MNERPSFEKVYIQFAEIISQRSTCNRLSVGTVITTTDYRIKNIPKSVSYDDMVLISEYFFKKIKRKLKGIILP